MSQQMNQADKSARDSCLEMVRRFLILAFERGLVEMSDEFLHPDFMLENDGLAEAPARGAEGVHKLISGFHRYFEGYTLRQDDLFAAGPDVVVSRFTVNAIHKGGYFGSGARGKSVNWTGSAIYRFKSGLIHRMNYFWDLLGTLVQLGAVGPILTTIPANWVVPPVPGTRFRAADRKPATGRPKAQDVAANCETVRKLIEGFTTAPLDKLIGDCYLPQYTREDPTALPGASADFAGMSAYIGMARSTVDNLKLELLDLLGDGDRVAIRIRATGKHRGGLFGVAGGGQNLDFCGMVIYRMEQCRIAQSWLSWEAHRMFTQLGVIKQT